MDAVVCHGPGDYRIERLPVPVPGPGEILIRVQAVGICGSDIKCFQGAAKFWGDDSRPAWAETGVVPGHEFVGEVVTLDDEARARCGVDVGDRVTSEQIVPCWQCRYCERGQYWMCATHDIYGFKRATPGGMAEYMVLPARAIVHRMPEHLPAAHAAFVEPLSCALHAVERADIRFGDVVVVAGAGPIGLGMIAGAAAKYPAHIVALDHAPEKLELATRAGAHSALRLGHDDVAAHIAELTDGYGADIYLNGTGHPSAVPQGLNLLRKLGTFVEYSVFSEDVTVDWTIISDDKELDVRGAHLGPGTWPTAIRMLDEGRLPMDRIVTHQLPLSQFADALEMVADGTRSIKVSLIPG